MTIHSLLCCVFLFISCQREQSYLLESKYAGILTINEKTVKILSDKTSLPEYDCITSFTNQQGKESIVGYNYKTHTLDFIHLDKSPISHTRLDREGNNQIIENMNGIFIHNEDSIWLYSNGIISLIDTTGMVQKNIHIESKQDEPIVTMTNFSIGCIKLYFDSKKNALYYVTTSTSDSTLFYVNEYNLNNDQIKRYPLANTLNKHNVKKEFGWKQLPNVTFYENEVIFNYPIESDIYRMNLETHRTERYGGKSKFTENIAHTLSSNFSFEDAERHKIENVHFFEVNKNVKKNIYYRLHLDKQSFDNKNIFEQYLSKQFYLTIFDDNFQVINEIHLNKQQKYSHINSWGCINDGFFINIMPQDIMDDNKDEYFILDIFDI